MNIGFDFNKGTIISSGDKPQNEDENRIIYAILDKLDVNTEMCKIEKNSTDYTTLKYKQYDLLRIKYTNGAKWIKILMANKELKNEYMDNPLFEAQKNKNEIMWKSTIDNIDDYIDIINKVIKNIKA